jgi:hypothetical protein
MTEPTPDDVRAFCAHMARECRASVRPKADAWEMRAAAAGLHVLGVFGLHVPSAEDFARRYVTTLGRTVFVPFEPGDASGPWSLWEQMMVIAHECEHIRQRAMRHLGAFEIDYLTSGALRAQLEADAYRCNMELHRWRFGDVPAGMPHALASTLLAYGCTRADVEVCELHLRSSAETSRRGGVLSHAAATAIEWLDEHAPHLRAP